METMFETMALPQPPGPLCRIAVESFLIAGQRIIGKEKRREAPNNPPLISSRHNPKAPWIL
jgi:hypothetical protein